MQNIVSGNPGKTLAYNGSFVYEGSSLKYILNEEGRYVVEGSLGSYEYNICDHLGSVRMVIDENGTIKQKNNYYPFGMRFATAGSSSNQYLYNGKELQEGTDWLDYGSRMYQPELGRWFCADPLAEKAYNCTPYRYCFNNPMNYIDPMGLWEQTKGGYTTNDISDISRFLSYLGSSSGSGNFSEDNVDNFIAWEMKGGGDIYTENDINYLLDNIDITRIDGAWVKDMATVNSAHKAIQRQLDEFYYNNTFDMIPDAIYFKLSIAGSVGSGGGGDFGIVIPLCGREIGIYNYIATNKEAGVHGEATANFGLLYYTGNLNNIDFAESFKGRSTYVEADAFHGISGSWSDKDSNGGIWISVDYGYGPSKGFSGGQTNVRYIYPFQFIGMSRVP